MVRIAIWLNKNREWLFSGIGITIGTLIWVGIKKLFCQKKKEKKQTVIEQVNYGMKSTQIGVQNNYYTKEENNERRDKNSTESITGFRDNADRGAK